MLKKPIGPSFALWEKIARNLTILFDEKRDYHPEYVGYKGKMIKQADAVLLNYPLGMAMPLHTAKNDILYYANRTDPHGPATGGWFMYSVGFMSVGDIKTGMEYFYKGYRDNCFAPYYQWYEKPGGLGCPNFITGAGGFLQGVWAGLTALRINEDSLSINPRGAALPPDATFIDLHGISYRGSRIRLLYQLGSHNTTLQLFVSLLEAGPLPLVANGITIPAGGETLQFDLTKMAERGAWVVIQQHPAQTPPHIGHRP